MDDLYNESWIADTCSGLALSIEFYLSGEFALYLGCHEPGCGDPQIYTGTFTIHGRRLMLSAELKYDIHEFYFFRFKGKNVIDTHKWDIDEVPGNEEVMGGCWGWWPPVR